MLLPEDDPPLIPNQLMMDISSYGQMTPSPLSVSLQALLDCCCLLLMHPGLEMRRLNEYPPPQWLGMKENEEEEDPFQGLSLDLVEELISGSRFVDKVSCR